MDFNTFFDMGGYAFYVWTAYGLAAVVLLGNLAATLRRENRLSRAIERFVKPPAGTR